MSFEQLRDIIARVRGVHRELAEFYNNLEAVVEKERVRMVLEYLSQHERKLENSLREFEESAGKNILNTFFKYAPNCSIREAIQCIEVHSEMSVDEVVCMALRLDEMLLRLYRETAECAHAEEVKSTFLTLYEDGKKDRARVVTAIFSFDL